MAAEIGSFTVSVSKKYKEKIWEYLNCEFKKDQFFKKIHKDLNENEYNRSL